MIGVKRFNFVNTRDRIFVLSSSLKLVVSFMRRWSVRINLVDGSMVMDAVHAPTSRLKNSSMEHAPMLKLIIKFGEVWDFQ
jgi:hypothetical protein